MIHNRLYIDANRQELRAIVAKQMSKALDPDHVFLIPILCGIYDGLASGKITNTDLPDPGGKLSDVNTVLDAVIDAVINFLPNERTKGVKK